MTSCHHSRPPIELFNKTPTLVLFNALFGLEPVGGVTDELIKATLRSFGLLEPLERHVIKEFYGLTSFGTKSFQATADDLAIPLIECRDAFARGLNKLRVAPELLERLAYFKQETS